VFRSDRLRIVELENLWLRMIAHTLIAGLVFGPPIEVGL
jgi:hypothetical protein